MTRRDSFQLTAVLVAMVLIVAACSGSGGGETEGTDAASSPGDTGASEVAAGGTVPPEPAPKFEPMSVSAPDCDYGGIIDTIEAVDELTVRFTLCQANVAFPSQVALSAFGIVPSEYVESTGGGLALVETPIGTGPYMLDRWIPGSQIIMQTNPDYWGVPPRTETLVFTWESDSSERLDALESGEVDAIDNVGTGDFAAVERDESLRLLERQSLDTFYLGFNRDRGPLADERVRQAIGYAVDRQRIVDRYYPDGSTVAEQFLPPAIPGYAPSVTGYEYDPERARELLLLAGFAEGFEITLSYQDVARSYLPDPGLVAADIQAQLAGVGITVNLDLQEPGVFVDNANAGELDLYLLGWTAEYPDATNFLDSHFGVGASAQFGEQFPDLVDVLDQASQSSDQGKRNVLYRQAAELLKKHAPMIPIARGGSAVAWKASAVGANVSPLAVERFSGVEIEGQDTFTWLQNTEPSGLYCADETDVESFRVCEQIVESLLSYEAGSVTVQPRLATEWEANSDLTVWTFRLRPDVVFHDGSTFDANDVVLSYVVQWDASHPLHIGRVGLFSNFSGIFGGFINADP